MKKILYAALILMSLGVVQTAAALPIAEIGFMPFGGDPSKNFSVNSFNYMPQTSGTFSVDVMIEFLPQGQQAGQIVSAYDLDVLYNSTATVNTSVRFAPWLGNPGSLLLPPEVLQQYSVTGTDGLPGQGVVNFLAGSLLNDSELLALQHDPRVSYPYVTLATLDFNVTAGTDLLLLFDWSNVRGQRDVKGLSSPGPDGFPLAGVILPAAPAVPEPGTLLLIGAGALTLLIRRRGNSD